MGELKAPDKIYLQITEEQYGDLRGSDITWCQDKINETDIEYTRTPAIDAEKKDLQDENNALSVSIRKCGDEIDGLKAEIKRLEGYINELKIECNSRGKKLVLHGEDDISFYATEFFTTVKDVE